MAGVFLVVVTVVGLVILVWAVVYGLRKKEHWMSGNTVGGGKKKKTNGMLLLVVLLLAAIGLGNLVMNSL
jgi:hypothetical protein